MIDVTFGRFALKVTFLLKTGLDADPDYALLVVGSLEGLKISLFAGGLLTGFGLIFGINRTLAVKAFQEGIKHRTVGAVLFPEDPVGNAPQLLQALKTLFPPAPEQSIIGITLQAAWLNKNIVKIELGILIEYPAPTRVVLLGKVALGLPSRQYGLVQINFDVIGILDFHDKFLSVDSVLYDSRIGKYPLTGGLAVRIRWGEDRDGAAALGGLHPRFQLPEGFPKLDRLAITIGQGNNPRIRGETYLGVTSNIFHFGLKAEFYVGAGGFSLEGILAFDLLFEFNPFSFLAEIDIGVSVRYKGRTLAGLRLSGMLAGPAPWQACGKVKIKILFIKVTKRFDCNWGDESNELIEAINVWRELEIALGNSDSWSGQLPPESQAVVSLQAAPPTGELFLHPLGQLELVQHVAPLGIELDKFQNAPIDGERRFDITAVTINDGGVEDVRPVKEQFAPGQFFEIEGDEAVTRPSFETFTAGIRVGSGAITHGAAVDAEFDYEEIVVNEETSRPSYRDLYQINSAMVLAGAEYGLMAQAVNGVRGRYHGPRHQIKRNQPGYLAVTVAGLAEVALSDPPAAGASYTEVKQAIERHLAQHPGARDKIQIVREHERRTP